MTDLFQKILNMSFSASILVMIVLFLRILLRKSPKWIHVLLWGMVAVRLVCPFSIQSGFSRMPKSVSTGQTLSQWADDHIGDTTILHDSYTGTEAAVAASRTPVPAGEEGSYVVAAQDQISAPRTMGGTIVPVLPVLWFLGVLAMLQYAFLSYDRLRCRVRGSVLFRDNISLCETVTTPFILGVFRPWIYLPADIPEPDICHVIAHERTHIQRKDHWWKPLGFLLLSIHWFNPLMWLAYSLLCRDIELACDEGAVKNMVPQQRADYSQSLLNCSVHRGHISACPLAFGEVGVTDRVKHVLSYKKPAVWLISLALVLCLVVGLCFLTDPKVSPELEWLRSLSASDLEYIEYRCYDAALDKQYHLYRAEELPDAAAVLNRFDGDPCDPMDPQSLSGSAYTLNIVLKNGQVHTVTNYGSTYLSVDNHFFENTHHILNQVWDSYFSGSTYLPSAENADLGVALTLESVRPTGATIVFDQYDSGKEYVLFGGNDYFLQIKTDTGWEALPTLESPTFTESSYSIANIRRHEIDWQWLYGTLSPGQYRIGKQVHILKDNTMNHLGTVYGEFSIQEALSDTAAAGVPNPYAILSTLSSEYVSCHAEFPEGGTGYTFFPEQTKELIFILRSLSPEDYFYTCDIQPKTTITLSHPEFQILLCYDGEIVRLSFSNSTPSWAVQSTRLNTFLDTINQNAADQITYAIPDAPLLTELSPYCTPEQASMEQVVTMIDGDICYNANIWKDFLTATENGTPATVQILKYYQADGHQEEVRAFYDLEYDGNFYILHSIQDGTLYSRAFRHLRREKVCIYPIQREYDEYECYFLTNSRTITVKDLDDDRFTDPTEIDQYTPFIVYTDLIPYPAHPEIPTELSYAKLEWDGDTVATVEDTDTLEKLHTLLSGAEKQTSGERPYAPGLNLILYLASGEVLALALDSASDLVRVGDNAYYDYGPNTDARQELFSLLGLNAIGSGDLSRELYGLMDFLRHNRSAESLERESDRLKQLLELENGT